MKTSDDTHDTSVVPVFINPESGSAAGIMQCLEADKRLQIHALPAGDMADAIRQQVAAGASRILVSGGDGTLALAAGVVAGTETALGVIPGGTLNHFAKRMGIPVEPQAALELALDGEPRPVDVGYVNGRLFLNTSSVGEYVHFVRTRERLERYMSYHLASVLAGIRRLWRWRNAKLVLDGTVLRTPLVFIGVGERELAFPALGSACEDGADGLHLVSLHTDGLLPTFKLAFNIMLKGADPMSRTQQLDSRVIHGLELAYRRKRRGILVATDGELALLDSPLEYRYAHDALQVVLPAH